MARSRSHLPLIVIRAMVGWLAVLLVADLPGSVNINRLMPSAIQSPIDDSEDTDEEGSVADTLPQLRGNSAAPLHPRLFCRDVSDKKPRLDVGAPLSFPQPNPSRKPHLPLLC